MATFNDPYGIGTGIGSYYSGAMANDPRLPAINRNISGQIAPDVRNMLAQSAAERGIGIGSYGGGNDQSSLLRALGLTSMDLTNKGIGQYGDAYNAVPQLRPGELFVNPTDEAQMRLQREMQTQRLSSERSMQGERLNSGAGLQAGQLAASSGQAAAARAQQQSQFDRERKDVLSAKSNSNARLQGIIARNSGGGDGGWGGGWQSGTLPDAVASPGFSWANYGSQPTIPKVDPVYYGTNQGYPNTDPFSTGEWGYETGVNTDPFSTGEWGYED
jgi:hypothetical protein